MTASFYLPSCPEGDCGSPSTPRRWMAPGACGMIVLGSVGLRNAVTVMHCRSSQQETLPPASHMKENERPSLAARFARSPQAFMAPGFLPLSSSSCCPDREQPCAVGDGRIGAASAACMDARSNHRATNMLKDLEWPSVMGVAPFMDRVILSVLICTDRAHLLVDPLRPVERTRLLDDFSSRKFTLQAVSSHDTFPGIIFINGPLTSLLK